MTSLQALSYCATCDARPGECDHKGQRYLNPIAYEAVDGGGWKVPDHERERWDNDDVSSVHPTATVTAIRPEPKPLPEIIRDLEGIVFLSDHVRTLIHDAYDTSPLQTWQLAENIKQRAAHMASPGGVLVSQLKTIITKDIPL